MASTAHIRDADLETYLRDQLDVKSAFDIQSHVRQCTTCEEKLVARLVSQLAELSDRQSTSGGGEQRLDRRVPKGESGALQALAPLSFERLDVHVLDVSRNGLGLLIAKPLESRTLVQVRVGPMTVLGEVCYCRQLENGKFHCGIRLTAARQADTLRRADNPPGRI